jgi:K+-sensing histidine kinase KdpD
MAAGQFSARRVATGLLLGAVLVAVVTAAIEGLRQVVPLLSLPILYLFAIFPLAIWRGAWLALAASAASMLTFDFSTRRRSTVSGSAARASCSPWCSRG